MAVVAGCLLPLVILKLFVQEQGIAETISTEMVHLLGFLHEATWLLLVLPVATMLFTMGLGWRSYRRTQRGIEKAGSEVSQEAHRPRGRKVNV